MIFGCHQASAIVFTTPLRFTPVCCLGLAAMLILCYPMIIRIHNHFPRMMLGPFPSHGFMYIPRSLVGNVGVVSGIFDMPTCRRCVADTTSATLHRVGSSDAMSVLCRHDDLPTCLHMWEKNTKSTTTILRGEDVMKSQKRLPPWQSRTPGLAAWLWYQQPPAPGYLIAMGWLTWHTKDFIQILKPAKKIINLMAASIFYYSLPPPNSTAPRTIEYHPPASPAGRASSHIPCPSRPR
jgi:hypothetical protein